MTDCVENILLLSIEDLNDWIEPLGGHPQALTPNLNRLAARAAVFERAYAASPACSPSRTAALFGQAPWRTGIYHNRQSWAMQYPQGARRSIIGHARDQGWETIGAGKIFHLGKSGLDMEDWSQFFHTPIDRFAPISKVVSLGHLNALDDFGPIPDDAPPMSDARNADFMVDQMQAGDTKKMWAYGTYRPHLPFIVPQKYFDMFDTPVQAPPGLKGNTFAPGDETEIAGLPEAAKKMLFRRMGRMLKSTGEYHAFVHAYLASIAYADAMVGRILDRLEETGLDKTTQILLWSDHGWQLGEKLVFRKFTLWERSLRVPMMLAGPGIDPGLVAEPVSLLDIYPTILKTLGGAAKHPLDGQDLMPIAAGNPGRGTATSMYERVEKAPFRSHLSATVRSQTHRLICYDDGSIELYDHTEDPYERCNLAPLDGDLTTSNIAPLIEDLLAHLPDNPAPARGMKNLAEGLTTHMASENGEIHFG